MCVFILLFVQEHDLKKVFMFCLQVLHEIDKEPNALTREAIAVLNRVLSIAEQVLCWEFTPKTCIFLIYCLLVTALSLLSAPVRLKSRINALQYITGKLH